MSAARKTEPPAPVRPEDVAKMSRPELLALARRMKWYHVIDLGDGEFTDGTFDIRPVLHHYGFPADMRGLRVLDLGRSSGYFSFEFERRRAEVVATDLPSPLDKEYVGHEFTREVLRRREKEVVRLDFDVAHALRRSRVKPVAVKLAELTLDAVGGKPFDLVFVGSILNHIKDPVGALERILAVTAGLCVVCNPVDTDNASPVPRARLWGRAARTLTTWWEPNLACLKEMVEIAGFEEVRVVSADLALRDRHSPMVFPHAVLHGYSPRDREAAVARWASVFKG